MFVNGQRRLDKWAQSFRAMCKTSVKVLYSVSSAWSAWAGWLVQVSVVAVSGQTSPAATQAPVSLSCSIQWTPTPLDLVTEREKYRKDQFTQKMSSFVFGTFEEMRRLGSYADSDCHHD